MSVRIAERKDRDGSQSIAIAIRSARPRVNASGSRVDLVDYYQESAVPVEIEGVKLMATVVVKIYAKTRTGQIQARRALRLAKEKSPMLV